jgi:two-component system response regulator
MNTERRILIIEDNPDDEELLMRELRKAGLQRHIRTIHDGKKALEFLNDENTECEDLAAVFLDLKLPRLHGLRILEAIRRDERLQNLPVIVMTSSNLPEELEKCRELGVSCYVQKPLTFSSFAKAFADSFQATRDAISETAHVGLADD